MSAIDLREGDCLDVMADMPADSVHAVITDPPYHLTSIVARFGADDAAPAKTKQTGAYARASRGFMGKEWDGGNIAFRPETWAAVRRVLKPGGHLLAFNHARTFDLMTAGIRAAGFELRDTIGDLYDTTPLWAPFLDSLNPWQFKALHRALASMDQTAIAWLYATGFPKSHAVVSGLGKLAAAGMSVPDETRAIWEGHGTALKPAFEPIVLARKPVSEASIARQCLATGTGALNIDGARINPGEIRKSSSGGMSSPKSIFGEYRGPPPQAIETTNGRWPSNIVHDGSDEVIGHFPVDNAGTAARFFFSAKAGKADRRGADHPTVKPHDLMRWLVRLATRPGDLILDPFGGSGATGWAARVEERRAILIERDPDYAAHIRRVIAGDAFTPQGLGDAADDAPQLSMFGG